MEMTSLADLLDVQDLDLQIDRLLERRQSLPELAAYKTAHEQEQQLTSEIQTAAAELKGLELDFDKAEGELQMLEAKLGEHETRLFAGGMSARETEHMRLEVQSLHGQREALEEKVLGMLERLDPVRDQLADLESRRDAVGQEKAGFETVIKAEWKQIDAELARKEERKEEAMAPVPRDLVELYETLRRSKEGVAIGRFEHGVCGGCHMTLSPTEQIEAFDADIPRCVHCRRILVA
ncbi:MAG TPA: C4-type zinc ribbon domain-containing protein [Acidimicrobiia bacterium]|nr:C4-type zinc ribbon domain-containing protein [Acidimicrobiia bacterium]